MKRRSLLALLFCLFFVVSYAQDHTNYIRTDLIAPSPTAGSIGHYGEVPLNLSTGALGLTIPIFEVKGNELSLPK